MKNKESAWTAFEKKRPTPEQAVEYKLEVVCKGHYTPSENLHTFVPDSKSEQKARIAAWRAWKEGPKYNKEDK